VQNANGLPDQAGPFAVVECSPGLVQGLIKFRVTVKAYGRLRMEACFQGLRGLCVIGDGDRADTYEDSILGLVPLRSFSRNLMASMPSTLHRMPMALRYRETASVVSF